MKDLTMSKCISSGDRFKYMSSRLKEAEELLKEAIRRLDFSADQLFRGCHASDAYYNDRLVKEIRQFLKDE